MRDGIFDLPAAYVAPAARDGGGEKFSHFLFIRIMGMKLSCDSKQPIMNAFSGVRWTGEKVADKLG